MFAVALASLLGHASRPRPSKIFSVHQGFESVNEYLILHETWPRKWNTSDRVNIVMKRMGVTNRLSGYSFHDMNGSTD